MLSPLPRRSSWGLASLVSPSRISLPRKGDRVDLRIVLFEDCSAFTRVAACTLALSPIRDTLIEGFSHFVTSMTAPIASGWSGCRVGLAPTGKRRLCTAHTHIGHSPVNHRPSGSGKTTDFNAASTIPAGLAQTLDEMSVVLRPKPRSSLADIHVECPRCARDGLLQCILRFRCAPKLAQRRRGPAVDHRKIGK